MPKDLLKVFLCDFLAATTPQERAHAGCILDRHSICCTSKEVDVRETHYQYICICRLQCCTGAVPAAPAKRWMSAGHAMDLQRQLMLAIPAAVVVCSDEGLGALTCHVIALIQICRVQYWTGIPHAAPAAKWTHAEHAMGQQRQWMYRIPAAAAG